MLSVAVVAPRSLFDAVVRFAGFGDSTMFRVAGATWPCSLRNAGASGSLHVGGSLVRVYSTGRVDENSGRQTRATPSKKLPPFLITRDG